jgi:hypothetical protein
MHSPAMAATGASMAMSISPFAKVQIPSKEDVLVRMKQ